MSEQPALYVFKGEDYCAKCMRETAPYYKSEIDSACQENAEYKKRVIAGTYMNPREDAGVHGKKKDRKR